ncbi:deubiquitination-protection protein [Acrasis kona]|uniref:Deubiquitination-protection protein n=1 Tax=Acrasis kona TaxID=1008807 RepID=A0AAW2Z724_9EUKA
MNWIQQASSRSSPIVLKVNVTNGEIRRVKLENPTHSNLLKLVNPNNNNVELSYRDYENDWVRFDTEAEWDEALVVYKYMLEKNYSAALSVKVFTKEEKEEAKEDPVEELINSIEILPLIVAEDSKLPVELEEVEVSDAESEADEVEPYSSLKEEEEEEKSEDDEALRQSMQAMRQSVSNFIASAPQAQPELPSAQYVKPEEEKTSKFQEQHKLLVEMGFSDLNKNVELLEKFKGDVGQVIQVYLN